ncbi:MAG: aminoglycoside phosphotransferase family protein [Halioglobus sp.]
MFIPLRDNNAHIKELCTRLNLGKPREGLSNVPGGFHHRVWRLETERGTFAVKQLAPDTDINDEKVVKHYNVSEAIASKFAECGLSTVSALSRDGKFLQVIDAGAYLVYPWKDAVALDDGEVSAHHALAVAELLAKMHSADIEVPGVEPELGEPSSEDDVDEMVRIAVKSRLKIAPLLSERRALLMRIARQYHKALPLLERHQIISHGDLDQNNVLWDSDDSPIIIDWEAAHKINPTHEVITVALEWSGITADFDQALYSRFVAAYISAGGTIARDLLEAAHHCVLGKWLDWLMYNIGRLVNLQNPKQRTLGEEQVEFTLPVMVKLDKLVPSLLQDLAQQATTPLPAETL